MSLRRRFASQPRWLLTLELFASIAALGVVDHFTAWELSLFVFYGLPIFAAAWYLEQRTALILATAGAVSWWLANAFDHPYATQIAYGWAAMSRWAYFVFVAIGGSALASRTEALQTRLEALERAARLERDLVQASEREQRRIGQDLHDGHCQTLTAIGFATNSLQEDLEARSAPEARDAEIIARMLKHAVAEVRGLARGIFPVQMNAAGLAAALDELAATTQRLRHIPVTFASDGDVSLADPQVNMHLYRIAQEALSNAATHSGATRISLTLSREGDQICLMIADDGHGLPSGPPRREGMGFTTMKYRASQIGAVLDIRSGSPVGTVVRCAVTCRENPAFLPHPHHAATP